MIRTHDTAGQNRPQMSTFELVGRLSAQAERERQARIAHLIEAHTSH